MTKAKTTAVLEHTDIKLRNTHVRSKCKGRPCTIHRRSKHSMRSFPQHWRSDKGLMERICSCGIGHPDPDEIDLEVNAKGIHGCCGHCTPGNYERLNGGINDN